MRSIHANFTYNHIYIIGVFLSLAMASVPPGFGVFRDSARIVSLVPVVGVCCLALTFFYPLYNRWSYKRIRGQLLQLEPETAASLEKHSRRERKDSMPVRRASQRAGVVAKSNANASFRGVEGLGEGLGLSAVKAIVGLPSKHR